MGRGAGLFSLLQSSRDPGNQGRAPGLALASQDARLSHVRVNEACMARRCAESVTESAVYTLQPSTFCRPASH